MAAPITDPTPEAVKSAPRAASAALNTSRTKTEASSRHGAVPIIVSSEISNSSSTAGEERTKRRALTKSPMTSQRTVRW